MRMMFTVMLLAAVLISSGCVSQAQGNSAANSAGSSAANSGIVEKVEILHFHGNHQCQGCINVGKCAEEAVNRYFQREQKSGEVAFAHVNGELAENENLVRKYGATGSSLWIGVYKKDGTFSAEQNINVWYKTGDMEKCGEYLKGVIEEKLKGA